MCRCVDVRGKKHCVDCHRFGSALLSAKTLTSFKNRTDTNKWLVKAS